MRLVGTYPVCTNSPRQAPNQAPNPAVLAAALWRDQVDLPAPTVYMAPGKAITGLVGCLEIGGPQQLQRSFPNVFGFDIGIQTTSEYDVDWGDGTPHTTTTSQGGPCRDGNGNDSGDIRHAYATSGTKTITVRQAWAATFTVNGGPPTAISGPLRTQTEWDIPVHEVQAVGQAGG